MLSLTSPRFSIVQTGALFVELNEVKPIDRDGSFTKVDRLSCYQDGFTNAVRQLATRHSSRRR